jgi:5'-nucleotidase
MLASVHGADVALMNAGGIRTGLPGGNVTLGDVLTMLPFGNTVAHLRLTGADLRDAVVHGLSRPGVGAFPQLAGLRLDWNALTRTLSRLELRRPNGSFVPVEPSQLYTLVTNNFLRSGGDGYLMLRDRAIGPYDAGPGLDVVVMDALASRMP